MFNNVIEAVDKTPRSSFNSIKNQITATSGVTESDVRASRINALQRQVSIFEKQKIFLTGVKGQEYPGPGDYRAPSDFGHYVSEKVVKERQVSSASEKIR